MSDTHGKIPNELEKIQIDLLKMEYEMTAQRYENIYKAVWQNFQYVAAFAAAILVFGGAYLPLEIVGILTAIPLAFWYFVTFLPLNGYGDEAAKQLEGIECSLNCLSSLEEPNKLNQWIEFEKRQNKRKPRTRTNLQTWGIICILLLIFTPIVITTVPNLFKQRNQSNLTIQFEEGAGATIVANEESGGVLAIDLESAIADLDTLSERVDELSVTTVAIGEATTNLSSLSQQIEELRGAVENLIERSTTLPEQEQSQ